MIRRIALALTLTAALAGLSACGNEDEDVTFGETEGVYVTTGDLKYQVQISRLINPYDTEDREYLYGLPPAKARLIGQEQWFGVFVRVENESKTDAHLTASRFKIEDTTGKEYEPTVVPPEQNPHFYDQVNLQPEQTFPQPNQTAGVSTAGGGLLLFKVPNRQFAFRPLELHIAAPTGNGEASVDLDV